MNTSIQRMGLTALTTVAALSAQAWGGGSQSDFTWNQPAGGAFAFPPNWLPFDFLPPGTVIGPPGPLEMATFDLGDAVYTVTFAQSHTNTRCRIGDDAVLFSLGGQTYTLTSTSAASLLVPVNSQDVGTLLLTNGVLNAQEVQLAGPFPSTGNLVVGSGATLNAAGLFTIGWHGQGSLTVQSGGDVSSGLSKLGHDGLIADGTGVAFIDGAGSTWNVSGDLFIGDVGDGTLTVQNGGVVFSATGVLGNSIGGADAATITGNTSAWHVANDLTVGNQGVGSVTAQSLGYLDIDGKLFLGKTASSTGTLMLQNDGYVNVAGGIFVGGSESAAGGVGTIDIGPDDIVSSSGIVRLWPGGTVNLNDGYLSINSLMFSGGTLNWTGGSLGLNGTNVVFDASDTTGHFGTPTTLSGTKSIYAPAIHVGSTQAAELNVIAGGGLSCQELRIGATVDAAVNVSASSVFFTQYVFLGDNPGSSGTLTLSDGAFWDHYNGNNGLVPVLIGSSGEGYVDITSGADFIGRAPASFSAVEVFLGTQSGSHGTLRVDGAGSTFVLESSWYTSIPMRIGGDGQGSGGEGDLIITNGGLVSWFRGADLAVGYLSNGHAIVDGEGSTWDLGTGTLNIGREGSGLVEVLNGASLEAGLTRVPLFGGDGELVVSGAGSQATLDELVIAQWGPGAVQVLDGALLTAGLTEIGFDQLHTGIVAVQSGATIAGAIEVGPYGTLRGDGIFISLITNGGTLAPGDSAGIMNVRETFTQSLAGTLEIELGGTTPGTQHDQLLVTGTVTIGNIFLDGTLDVVLINEFAPQLGDQFMIVRTTTGTISGTFTQVNLPKNMEITYTPTAVIVGVPGISCPADIVPLGGNGQVNVDDLLIVINSWVQCFNPDYCPADIFPASGNDIVNVDDLLAVINAWGMCP